MINKINKVLVQSTGLLLLGLTASIFVLSGSILPIRILNVGLFFVVLFIFFDFREWTKYNSEGSQ